MNEGVKLLKSLGLNPFWALWGLCIFIIGLVFNGLHTSSCLLLGSISSYWFIKRYKPTAKNLKIGSVILNHNRGSFLFLFSGFFNFLNSILNKNDNHFIRMIIRLVFPHFIFFPLLLIFGMRYDWYFVFLGSLVVEYSWKYKEITKIQ